MISLKRHIDDWKTEEGQSPVLSPYSSLLRTIGSCGSRAVPELGGELESKLSKLN